MFAAPASAVGPTIDTTGAWVNDGIGFFGYPGFQAPHPFIPGATVGPTPTMGQTITVAAGPTVLQDFSFWMRQPASVAFRGFVYAWDGEKLTGSALWEGTTVATSNPDDYEKVTFTPNVTLPGGTTYVLFASVLKDAGSGGGGVWRTVAPGSYSGGQVVAAPEQFSSPPLTNQQLFDRLSTTFWFNNDVDLAFQATLGVVRDSGIAVSCSPQSIVVAETTTCTATVDDAGSVPEIVPTGDVDFTIPDAAGVLSAASCTLAQVGTTDSSSCSVDYTPSRKGPGSHAVNAAFDASAIHRASNSGTTVDVDHRATTTSVACSPTTITVGGSSVCTTTVEDTDTAGTNSPPDGTATASSADAGGFTGNGCTLAAPVGNTKKCSTTYAPTAIGDGSHGITSAYTHDPTADSHADSSDTSGVEVTVVPRGTTSILYTGQQLVTAGANLPLKAHLMSDYEPCEDGQQVDFSLDRNPVTGAAGTYSLGSDTTDTNGVAEKSQDTTGWLSGVYDVTAAFAETADCEGSSDTTLLTVAGPGDKAVGGGWYKLPQTTGSPRNNFGFTVRKRADDTYAGQLVIHNNGKWRLKGTITQYGQTTPNGAANGTGNLYKWNDTTDWTLCEANVSFTASFTDGGVSGRKKTTATPDLFGIQLKPALKACSLNLPNSKPQALKGGDIKLQ